MATKTEFCDHCEETNPIVTDKPWLPAVCLKCGRNV